MAGWFELKKSSNDKFHFALKAGNAESILQSEMYESKAAAMNGIESVQKNSGMPERFSKETSAKGQPYFTLKAANHQVIGTSEMYSSESARDNGIESVMKNGSTTDVRDKTG